jgi:peptidoglycan hydrolase CwlO-like protein
MVVLLSVALCALGLAGCAGPGHVQYDGGRCLKDGRPLTAAEVEADQAEVARRIASRQPWFAVITISVVLLAAAGNAEKALLLIRARHVEGHRPLAERLREVLARHRESPVRFAAIVGGSLGLIAIAGSAYIYLDIDKRASERALGMLQFCHLAMRTEEEEGALDEQRHNLQAIESTAGDIRALVGKLPPDEQRKAQLIVDQMNTALAKQGKIVGEYVARTDEAQKDLSAHTVAMEKGIASVEGELADLRSLPASLKDLEGAAHRIDETTASFDARFAELRARIGGLEDKVDSLVARPACSLPVVQSTASKAPASAAPSASAPVAAPPQAQAVPSRKMDSDAGDPAR